MRLIEKIECPHCGNPIELDLTETIQEHGFQKGPGPGGQPPPAASATDPTAATTNNADPSMAWTWRFIVCLIVAGVVLYVVYAVFWAAGTDFGTRR